MLPINKDWPDIEDIEDKGWPGVLKMVGNNTTGWFFNSSLDFLKFI